MKRRYTALWLMLWLLLGLVAGCGNQEEAQGGQQTPDSQQEEQTDPKDDGADQPEDSKEEPQTPAGQESRLEPAEEAAAQATAQGITQQGIYWRQGEDGKRYVVFNGVDRAYSGMQGHLDEKTGTLTITGEDGKLQGYLDMMGVPYSSCSMTSSVITFDKITAKRTLAGRVNLAREVFLRRGEAFDPAQIVAELGMPLFVKPNANGSSFGVTKVHAPEELPTAIEAAFAQGDEILIEECVAGREMGCGMLVAGGREYVFPITEIVSKKDFFDYEAKYTAGFSDEITPADITPEVKAELNRMTREAYRTCRCSGVVRVDFIVTPAGVPYFIELNSIPGMSGGSIVPKQAREMGMSLGELYDIIIADTCRK